jgi:hypothetical protein
LLTGLAISLQITSPKLSAGDVCLRILGWAEILQISGLDWTNGIGLVLQNSGIVLEKVCEYLCYNEKNKDQNAVPDMEIPPELCLELLMAADYLDSRCFHLPRAFHANMSQNVLAYKDDQLEIKDTTGAIAFTWI